MSPFKTTLTGELVTLRPLRPEDREVLFAAAADPLIWEQHPVKTRYQRPVFDQFFDTISGFESALVVIDRESGKIIGTSSYYEYLPQEPSVSIGYTFIARAYWGHTYNREMKRLMLDHAFRFVSTAYFHIGADNIRSQAAIKKIGAVECGQETRPAPDGSPIQSLIFKVVRPKT